MYIGSLTISELKAIIHHDSVFMYVLTLHVKWKTNGASLFVISNLQLSDRLLGSLSMIAIERKFCINSHGHDRI